MNNKISYAALAVALLALIWPQLQPSVPSATKGNPLANPVAASTSNSVFERVTTTKTLRCAYAVYPPETIKDPNTGKLSGMIVELTEAVAAELGWKVEWSAEVGAADMFAGFASKKYDAICAGTYETPHRSLQALYSIPVVYGADYAFVRANDNRFDKDLSVANNSNVRVAFVDGQITQTIAEQNFSAAQKYSLPTLSGIPQLLESVATGKADMTFTQISAAKDYMDHNPNKIKIAGDSPLRTYVESLLSIPLQEHDLKYVIDATLRTLHDNGTVEKITRKYDPKLESHLLLTKPYQAATP